MSYRSVVMAGGGSRCFWHAGFWSVAAGPLKLAPEQVATVSASGAIGGAILAGVPERALEVMKAATKKNPKNAYPANVLRGEPVFPHLRIYRQAILDIIDAAGLARIHAGPRLSILLGRYPRWLGARSGALTALAAYNLDKRLRRAVHPVLPTWLGFWPQVVPATDCRTPEELADLILASSCTPPMTPLLTWQGAGVLDGGVVDNVPVCALTPDPGPTLVLLTRRYPRLPDIPGRTYVQPSQAMTVSAWDYTNPGGLQQAYDLGRRDGEVFARQGPLPFPLPDGR